MKKQLIISTLLGLTAATAMAQDTYLNDRATNTSDVIGTARYVGMGGAMGALGADISVISNNPAGIALFRRSNASLTLGTQIQDGKAGYDDSKATFSFDQLGFVLCMDNDEDFRLNLGFNYQKRINYNQSFLVGQPTGGLSQADMFSWVANSTATEDKGQYYFGSPFYDNLYTVERYISGTESFGFFKEKYAAGTAGNYFRNLCRGTDGYYYRHSWGSLSGFDINVSASIQDRYYLGLTVGIDHMRYRQSASYEELGDNPYILYQDQKLDGTGFNVKLGAIVRPFEDSPLRFGAAIETPTWFALKHNAWAALSTIQADGRYSKPSYMDDDNYLEYNVYSPWKFRASVGSTVENYLAWDIEYEYSMNNWTKMGYPDEGSDYYSNSAAVSMNKDRAMNDMTHRMVQGVHNIRAGMEFRPADDFAVRIGYNFYSRPFKKGARLDQSNDSPAFDWCTSTEYINLGCTNIFTLGLGYQGKNFYADLAYKYRAQRGQFYAFDDNFTSYNESFYTENPTLKDAQLSPTNVNLDRHHISLTLGYRF